MNRAFAACCLLALPIAAHAFDLTEEHTRAPYEPAADRKAFAALLADEVIGRVLHPEPGQWSPLVDTVQRLGDEKDLLLYSFDPEQQALIAKMGWDGGVSHEGPSDYLMVVDASVNSTKLNAVVEHSADIDVKLGKDGTATTTVSLQYYNPLTEWAAGRDPALVRKLMLGGMYGGYVRLLTPAGSRIVSVHDGDAILMAQKLARELGLGVGISSGANLVGAMMLLERMGGDATVVTVFADSNKKYLSTDLLREEPVRDGYVSADTELTGFNALPRVCSGCIDF